VRLAKIVGGFGLLIAGTVMLVFPGPGWLTIVAGLSLLAAEFPWARRALDWLTGRLKRLRKRLTRRHGKSDGAGSR
jgi:uncharacterized protein (TIGR02611 family)